MDMYFAQLPPEEIGPKLKEKVDAYFAEADRRGRMGLWRKAYRAFFSLDKQYRHEASEVQRGGEQGELHLLKANHFRNLLTHLHVILTQQRPAFDCRSTNSDYKSQTQTLLASNILEYYMREQGLEAHFSQAIEYCLLYAEAYLEVVWNSSKGEIAAVDQETGAPINAGDIDVRVYPPDKVIRSCRADADMHLDWYILEREVSKYDLAAKYPQYADQILHESTDSTNSTKLIMEAFMPEDEDRVSVYTLYHDRTDACPTGRQVTFIGDITLEYSDLKYAKLPVHRMAAYNQHGTSFGYSISFDLLCVQEAIDLLYSTVLSNQAAFGVQSVWIKRGDGIDETQLASGLNVIESDERPEPVNLTQTPPEIFNFIKQLETLSEVLSGVNSVARGQPEASLKSGAALALVAAQAVQFANGVQAAGVRLMEEACTSILKTLQENASIPRTAMIAGIANRSFAKEFCGEDISSINRVIVDLGNPMARLASGRIQMAQDLLQAQVIKNPEQYIQVVTTGRLEPLIEDQQSELLWIRAENEALKLGKPVRVVATDMHPDHIKGHKSVFADPEVRSDPTITQAALDHIQEHINALKTVDPALLNMLGMNPIAPPPPQPQAPGGAPSGAQPQDLGNLGAPAGQTAAPGEQAPAPPNTPPNIAASMPTMPKPAQVNPQQ